MDTILTIAVAAGTLACIVSAEAKVRRLDRRHAQAQPARLAAARLEHKMTRRADALREHLTPDDLRFLARNGSEFAHRQLKAIEAPKKPEPEPVYHGKKPSTIRSTAEHYYMRHGYWPWEKAWPSEADRRMNPYH